MMIIERIENDGVAANTVIVADDETREAVLIDPVLNHVERDEKRLAERNLKLVATLETQLHTDHVTGGGVLRIHTGSRYVAPRVVGAECADILVSDGDRVSFGRERLTIREAGDGVAYVASDGHIFASPDPAAVTEAAARNMRCGYETDRWIPIARTAAGVPEVSVETVMRFHRELRVIDVRGRDEWDGDLGHLECAELVPMETLERTAADWAKDTRLVTICRSGGRSGRAAVALEKAGFSNVASMAGGMLRWRAVA